MKAYICPKYGPPEVLRLEEVETPSPRSDEVRIKVRAAGVTASDIFIRGSQIPLRYRIPMRLMIGVIRPRRRVIGLVLAGEIDAVGADIRRFKVGDRVYAMCAFGLGAYAEYKCMHETDSLQGCVALMPSNLTYEEGTAAVYGGLLALQYLERGNIRRGQKVLIYGASSTSGTVAVQFAKHLGADVTGVCSTVNLGMVRSLGADHVLDYTREDRLRAGERFDLVLDAVGRSKTSRLKKECRRALAPQGRHVSIDDGALQPDSGRLDYLRHLVEAGCIRPVLDRTYPFEELVEAHRYVAGGHKRGGVALTVSAAGAGGAAGPAGAAGSYLLDQTTLPVASR